MLTDCLPLRALLLTVGGRRLLGRVATIVTPDTIMRWHRQLIAAKWTLASRPGRRKGVMREIRALVIRCA